MSEKPILFSGEMVRAILAGRKTQTRRVVKQGPVLDSYNEIGSWDGPGDEGEYTLSLCPYGKPGDTLWVRETWYCDDYRVQRGPYKEVDGAKEMTVYRADDPTPYEAEQPTWRPSIHMPRWASRITLRVTDVRVERVQDISEEDAIAEGIQVFGATPKDVLVAIMATMTPVSRRAFLASALALAIGVLDVIAGRREPTNAQAYAVLWDKINAKKHPWSANPWAWVVKFEVRS